VAGTTRRRAGDDAGRGEEDQHLPAPAQPERDRGAARGLSRLPENPDPKTVFVKLRELRNSW
jgi:hypothetical protein